MADDNNIRPAALERRGAARYCGIAPKTLSNYAAPSSSVDGPPFRLIGRKPVYLVADLDRWLASRPVRCRNEQEAA